MKKYIRLLLLIMLVTHLPIKNIKCDENINNDFYIWSREFKIIAKEKYGITEKTLEEAFKNIEYKHKIIKFDRNQPEFVKTFWNYYDNAVHPLRIKRGKNKMMEHSKILNQIRIKYKIPPNILIAFWGIETDYGRNMGNIPIISALATLSFDHRRSKFFTEELIQALKILQNKKIKNIEDYKGSWAGGYGNFQFIPSTFSRYAIDGDGDGKIDLRNNIADSLYSAANFLSKMGWNGDYRWGRPVSFDKKNKKIWSEVNSKQWESLNYFSKLGIRTYKGNSLPKANIKAKLIAPMGIDGPVFLVYENFKYIMRWNNSTNYALSVGLLSDALILERNPNLKSNNGIK